MLASIYSVTVNTNNTGIVVSATKPADTTVVWKQLNSSGNPIRDYIFVGGFWLSRHAMEPGEIVLWRGSVANLWTFDGGDGTDPDVPATAPTLISGAMWRQVTELSAKMPLGVGSLPSGTAVAVGDVGGEEKHLLTVDELAGHTHPPLGTAGTFATFLPSYGADNLGNEGLTNVSNQQLVGDRATTGPVSATSNAHQNMPPYLGVYFIERTRREYFVVP